MWKTALLLSLSLLPTQASRRGQPVGEPIGQPVVENGIDVLVESGFEALAGRRIGLISNHTGVDQEGTSTALLLHRAKNLTLVRLFSPEHGFEGKKDSKVGDAVHEATGLPIVSLYTQTRAPSVQSLEGIDTLVFDIQDIGCRFYTYISTMGEAMRVAARHKLRFVVLDRPNPIDGVDVGGPVRDVGRQSFVAWHGIPIRHGMTVGELARMFDAELGLHCDLQVIRMKGWKRTQYFDATGQTWIDPSPNMRSPVQALLYPGVGLLETTNVSVGRGTDTPFELLGAPWMDGPALARAINASGLPGIRCIPIHFTPRSSKHKGKRCSGIRFWVIDRARFDPIALGMWLACEMRRLHPKAWDLSRYDRLLVHKDLFDRIAAGARAPDLLARILPDVVAFRQRRQPFLLYR